MSRLHHGLLTAIGIVALLSISYSVQNRFFIQRKAAKITISPEILPHIVLGFKNVAADSLWIRLIQEIDYRDNEGTVSKGWAFHMLDGITSLDPRYRIAYAAGLTVLAVVVQDVEGARILYERGVKNFPSDWPIIYRAASHYLIDVKDCKRAAELFQMAAEKGAPLWLNSLASRLYTKAGRQDIARVIIKDSAEKFKNTNFAEHFNNRLKALETESRAPAQASEHFDCM